MFAVFVVFFAANVFDMGGGFGIKYLSYVLLAAALLWRSFELRFDPRHVAAALALFVVWPVFSLIRGLSDGGELATGIRQITPFFPGILVFFCAKEATLRSQWPLGIG